MFDSLGRIQNPWARSLTAAFTVGSVVTLVSSIAIAATNPKSDSAHKVAVYATLIGVGCGAAFGLAYTNQGTQKKAKSASQTNSVMQPSNRPEWHDWRNFVVTRKVKESEEITSFYLEPEDQGEIPIFAPGQFLPIKLEIPGLAQPVIRTYSLSDYADPCHYYRLSIKREPAPKGVDVPPGLASNFMHDQVHVGSMIAAKPPNGKFVLDVKRSLPAVLISNGVGITPMISMAKAVIHSKPRRPIWFLHGARDGAFHAFREEMLELAQNNPDLILHFAYSRPQAEDDGKYHSVGYVDSDLVQSLVMQEAEYFLCGSPPFLDSIRAGLKQAGVPDNRVFFEMFAKAPKAVSQPTVDSANSNLEDTKIVFQRSHQTFQWQANTDSLLEFAEANGLNPPYSCRQGICGTCQCKLLAGEVEYQEPPTAAIDEGSVLICIAKPKTSAVVLDL